ncbi:MAG: FTR1 family protein, partial [Actinomyces graevenitzii]|nr:FTR1 family protein [Actinomyces graevenitzii]
IWIAIFAVGREGIETALFIWATVRSAVEKSTPAIAAGVVGGLVVAIVLGYLIYRGGVRINLSMFFTVTGYFLIVVAAGIISYGFGDLQEASLLPGWAHHAWDVSNWVPQSSVNPLRWLYEVSVALFQVNPTPTRLQVIGWNIYFWPTLYFFARVAHAKSGKAPKVESKAE